MLAAFLTTLLALTPARQEPPPRDPANALAAFVEIHRKPDGGFGAPCQPDSEERWIFWALRALELVGRSPADPPAVARALERLARDGRAPLPARDLARLEAARLLKPAPELPERRLAPLASAAPALMTWMGSAPLRELELEVARRLLRCGPIETAPAVAATVAAWRQSDGGWGYPLALAEVYLRALPPRGSAPEPRTDQPSSMESTAAGVAIAVALGLKVAEPGRIVRWIEAARGKGGGYRHRHAAPRADLWATWHALRTLRALGARPAEPLRTAAWVFSLHHVRGGFTHARDEPPSLEATWLALECLDVLGAGLPPFGESTARAELPAASDPGDLKIWQAAVEIAADEALTAELASRIGADLVLVKGAHAGEVVPRIRAMAGRLGHRIAVACGREEYNRAWGTPGVGYATHVSDVFFEPGRKIGTRAAHQSFGDIDEAWRPLRQAGGLVAACAFRHRELLAPAYDRSVRTGEGYDLLAATWPFVRDADLVREHPWLHRYVGRLPVFGNHDAHVDPFHWLDHGVRARTVFFAETGDFAGFRAAVRAGRVVAVAHGRGREALYGHPYWVERARAARKTWDRGRRPGEAGSGAPAPVVVPVDAASATLLRRHPEGYALLVRAAERPGDDAFPSEVRCRVDGREVRLRSTGPESPASWAPLPGLAAGDHEVCVSAFGRETRRTLRFGEPAPESDVLIPRLSPASLDFDRALDQLDFTVVPPPPPRVGALPLCEGRADVFLTPTRPGDLELLLAYTSRPGAAARVYFEGRLLGELPDGGPALRTLAVGRVDRRQRFRISIRTAAAPWDPVAGRGPELLTLDRIELRRCRE